MIFNAKNNIDIDIAFLETQIELEKSINDYLTESDILSLGIFTEEEETAVNTQKKNGFLNFIKRFTDTLIHILQNLAMSITSLFGNDHLKPEDFIQSDTGKQIYMADIEKINKECDDQILKGRELIQKISNGTGVNDETVAKYVDGAANFANNNAVPVLLTASSALVVVPKVRGWIDNKLGLIRQNGDTLQEAAVKNYESQHPEDTKKITKIYNAMGTCVNKFVNTSNKYLSTFATFKYGMPKGGK